MACTLICQIMHQKPANAHPTGAHGKMAFRVPDGWDVVPITGGVARSGLPCKKRVLRSLDRWAAKWEVALASALLASTMWLPTHLHVKADCDAWVPSIKRQGWLILDDYVCSHGDGPRRVGIVGYWIASGLSAAPSSAAKHYLFSSRSSTFHEKAPSFLDR
jgi:hypothetical protein